MSPLELEQFGFSAQDKILLSARVCRPQNNIESIINAFKLCNTDGKLVILTGELADRAYTNRLVDECKSDKRIVFLPTVTESELSLLYNVAQSTLSLPFIDQLSTTILESLTCGTSVICSDIPPYKERISQGQNGFLVNPIDISSLTSIMLRALTESDYKLNMEKASRKSVAGDSWDENSVNLIKLYDAPLNYDKQR